MPLVARQRLRFGPFELDLQSAELFKFGQKLKLQGQPIQVLTILVEKPGELVTREELRQRLWPTESETFVDFEHGLNTDIRKLRAALGDEAETPRYIETLPRRGYRFVGEIDGHGLSPLPASATAPPAEETAHDASPPTIAEPTSTPSALSTSSSSREEASRRRAPHLLLLALLVSLGLLAITAFLFRWARGTSNGLAVTSARQLTYNGALGMITGTSEIYGSMQTDGHRIYYTVLGENPLRYMSVNGGEEAALACPLSQYVTILHISPDGSTLLVKDLVGPRGSTESALWLVAVNGGTVRKLGDIEAQDAAFAPDGKTIVFAKGRDVYLTDTQGTSPVKLAVAPGRAFWLRWSPDGLRLRFSVVEQNTQRSTLWELRRDYRLHQLLTDRTAAAGACCGIWTADGRYYLFRSNRQYWYVRDAAILSQSEPTLLTTSGIALVAAAASPLGKTVFVKAALGTYTSFEWDLKTNRTSAIYPDLKPAQLEYSRDGQWIAYGHSTPSGQELWRARVDGSERQQLTAAPMEMYMTRYSPDGRNLVFMARWPSGPWKIYWVSADGGALHEVSSPVMNQADPNWSPDSQSILFGQPPESWVEADVPRQLYRYDLRTHKTVEIPSSTGLFSPRWSPDGRYVAAMSVDFQSMSILEVTTGHWRLLTRQPTDEPFWSLDSEWLYFNDFADTGLWRIQPRDGRLEAVRPIPVPSGYAHCNARAFAPNGSVLLSCRDSRADIFALDLR